MNGECEELRKPNGVAHKFEDTINKANSKQQQQQQEKKIISSMKKDLFYTPRRKESTLQSAL